MDEQPPTARHANATNKAARVVVTVVQKIRISSDRFQVADCRLQFRVQSSEFRVQSQQITN
jgi:hypothetical protein